MTKAPSTGHAGLDALLDRPLIETIWRRRTHRVSQGSSVLAGSMSYQSTEPREPLSELEEAILIAMTGCTGLTMPDRPFEDPATHAVRQHPGNRVVERHPRTGDGEA